MSSSKYIPAAVSNVKAYHSQMYPTRQRAMRTSGPFSLNYAPKLDVAPVLDLQAASFYQTQIDVLRWCVELHRIDVIIEVSELASYLTMPREGHLEAMFHLYDYLEKRHNASIVMTPPIQNWTCQPSRNATGRRCMAMLPRQFRRTLVRTLTYNCMLTWTTLARSACADHAQGFSYI
jgi:hypothetical protein